MMQAHIDSTINNIESNNIGIYKELAKHYDTSEKYHEAFKYYQLFNDGLRMRSSEWIKASNLEQQINDIRQLRTTDPFSS